MYKNCFLLGTLHRGSSFSMLGGLAARLLWPLGSNLLLLRGVAYDSIALLDLQEQFEDAFNVRLQVVNVFECRRTRFMKVWFFQWEAFVSELGVLAGAY